MSFTVEANDLSISAVRHMIAKKNSDTPFLANGSMVKNSVTDMDHHPYTRWYRGVYYYPEPIVAEREAGWRPLRDSCYDLVVPVEPDESPALCYEAPCSTTFPCFPNLTTRYNDREVLRHTINDMCIVQYR
jgi:hypothetical protein